MLENLLRKIYKETYIGKYLSPIKSVYDFYRFRLLTEKYYIKRKYKNIFGVYPNLQNPQTFSEKIQWLKLHDRTSLHTMCADKYRVREYVKKHIGEAYLIPLVFHTKNTHDICKENMPDYPVIIKTNHDSGGGEIVYNKHTANFSQIRANLKKRLRNNYYYKSKEWQYKNIEKCIIVEKLLLDSSGKIPNDIKVYCLNGKSIFTQIDIDRFTNHKRNIYNENWEVMPFIWGIFEGGKVSWKRSSKKIKKPVKADEILSLSIKLSQEFIFARIDLYDVDDKIYFGEITFHPDSGHKIMHPKIWDRKLGDMLVLPTNI